MRIPSGKTDQKIFFVAVDATDLVTRETGLSGFTVYRSRNGGAATAYTTPTVAELSSGNMPGVYALTIDEDTTIGGSSDSEEYCVHITCAGMAPVTRTIELYRRDVTTGRTLAVDSNSRVDVGSVLGTAQTAGDLAAMITAVDNYVDTEVAAIKAKTDNLPNDPADASDIATAFSTVNSKLDAIDDYVDTEVAAIYSRIGAPVGASISADIAAIKSQTGSIETKVDTIDDYIDTEVAAIKAKTDNIPSDPADASDISSAFGTVNSTLATIAGYIDTEVAAIKAKTDNLPDDPADASDIASAFSTLSGKVDTIDDFLDTEIAAIKAKTDNLPASPAATSDIVSAVDVADAVWDSLLADHVVADTFGEYVQGITGGGGGGLDAAGVRAAIGLASANLDTQLLGISSQIDAVDDFVDTEVGAIKTVVDAIQAKTDNLPSDPADASVIADEFVTINSKLDAIDDYVDTEVAAIKAKTDNLPSDPADASDIAARFTTVDGNIAAIKAKTDNLPASIPTANQNADALLDRANGIETGYTPRQALKIMSAVLGGKSSGHPGSPVYRDLADTADRVTATVSSGNRSAVAHSV